ncbi:STAS domain-containing protein [Streptosporangium sp. NPDC003464]
MTIHSGIPESDDTVPHDTIDAVIYVDRQLRLTYRPTPGTTLIRLIGEIDATNRTALEETLTRARYGDDRLLIDVGHLRFIDVGGMCLLAELCHTGAACVVNVPPPMRRLANLLGLLPGVDALVGAMEHGHDQPRQG